MLMFATIMFLFASVCLGALSVSLHRERTRLRLSLEEEQILSAARQEHAEKWHAFLRADSALLQTEFTALQVDFIEVENATFRYTVEEQLALEGIVCPRFSDRELPPRYFTYDSLDALDIVL